MQAAGPSKVVNPLDRGRRQGYGLAASAAVGVPPGAPSAPEVNTTPTDTTALASWTSGDGAEHDVLQWAVAGTSFAAPGEIDPAVSTQEITGLTAHTSYDLRAKSVNAYGESAWATSLALLTTEGPPVWNAGAAIISDGDINIPGEGDTLTADGSDCEYESSLSYQWQIDTGTGWADIGGATASTHGLGGVSSGQKWRCVITGTNSYGSADSTSNETGAAP